MSKILKMRNLNNIIMQGKKNVVKQGNCQAPFLGPHKTEVFRGKNKRGISAIEMVVSFTIFMAFLVFIFIYINPLNTPAQPSNLALLEAAVYENAAISIEQTGFAVNKSLLDNAGAVCFAISENLDKMFVTDSSGGEVEINPPNSIKYTGEKFYYLNNKTGINGKTASLTGCFQLTKDASYSLSVPRIKKVYSNSSLSALKTAYDSDYNKLKNDLKLPASYDFSIIVLNAGGAEILKMSKDVPRVRVIAREVPIEILSSDSSGTIIAKGYLRLLVW